jgi:hypothetical protein
MNASSVKTALVLLAVLAALFTAFFLLFEKTEKEIRTPGSPEARKNPFLAAERFLEATGIPAESLEDRTALMELPAPDEMIIVNRLGANLPEERERRLIQWIEKGGALVLTHERLWNEDLGRSGNTLLDRLGVRQYDICGEDSAITDEPRQAGEGGLGPQEAEEPGSQPCKPACSACDREVVQVPAGHGATAEIEFMARYILEEEENAADDGGITERRHVITKPVGDGRLIVFSDNRFLTNEHIGKNDHAFYLARLAANREKIWILYSSNMPSFASVLLKKAPLFCLSLPFFLLFYLLWLSTGIGPRYRTNDHVRRNITEHLFYAGRFLRGNGMSRTLIRQVRSSLEKSLSAARGRSGEISGRQRYEMLAEGAGLSIEEIESILTKDPEKTAAFIRQTQALQRIHATITAKRKRGPL